MEALHLLHLRGGDKRARDTVTNRHPAVEVGRSTNHGRPGNLPQLGSCTTDATQVHWRGWARRAGVPGPHGSRGTFSPRGRGGFRPLVADSHGPDAPGRWRLGIRATAAAAAAAATAARARAAAGCRTGRPTRARLLLPFLPFVHFDTGPVPRSRGWGGNTGGSGGGGGGGNRGRCLKGDVPDRKSTRLNSSHITLSRMPSSA